MRLGVHDGCEGAAVPLGSVPTTPHLCVPCTHTRVSLHLLHACTRIYDMCGARVGRV